MVATRKTVRHTIEMTLQRMADVVGRLTRGMTLGVRALVIGPDGRIFLVKHSYVGGWHLPGGGVEPGETLIDALIRELREEGNLEPTAPPVLHGILQRQSLATQSRGGLRGTGFLAAGRAGAGLRDHHHGFFGLDELPDDTTAATRARSSRRSAERRSRTVVGAPPRACARDGPRVDQVLIGGAAPGLAARAAGDRGDDRTFHHDPARTADDAAAIERLRQRTFGPGRLAKTLSDLRRRRASVRAFPCRPIGTLMIGSARLTPGRIGEAEALVPAPLHGSSRRSARAASAGP